MAAVHQHCFNVKITSCACLRSGCHCSLIPVIRHMWCLSGTCSRCALFSCYSGSPTLKKLLFYWKLFLSTGQLNLYLIMCKIYQMSCDLTKSLTFPSLILNKTKVLHSLSCLGSFVLIPTQVSIIGFPIFRFLACLVRWYLRGTSDSNENVDIKCIAYDAFLESSSGDTLKIERLENQII
jgi:hypothetical protein